MIKDSTTGAVLSLSVIIIGAAALLVAPMLLLVWMSVSREGVLNWAGYAHLFKDDQFIGCIWKTVIYAILTVIAQVVVGIFAAAIVHKVTSKILTILLFLPYAVPSIVAIIMWKFLIEEQGGFAYASHRLLGAPLTIWMGDWVFVSLIIISVWQFSPFVFIVVLAQMRRIPPALYLSAQTDGAGIWKQFRYVSLPQIKSTLLAVVVLRLAFMATKFDTPWLLAGRTANDGVSTLPIYIYEHRTVGLYAQATPGVAAAVLMAACVGILIAIVQLAQILRKRNEEE